MKQLFKPSLIKWSLIFLAILLLVKLFWLAIELFYLPASGINKTEEAGGKSLYYRVNLSPNKAAPKKAIKPSEAHGNIKDLELLAIYNAPDKTVVTVVYKHKSKILEKGEEINGFMLEDAGSTYALFSKGGKTYRVDLITEKEASTSGGIESSISSNTNDSSAIEGEVIDAGDHKIIDKSLLKHYATNMDDIYKNIGIQEMKSGNGLKFKITFVKRGSPFAKLGVRRGDIIKSINGQEINSYNAAFNAYKNIENVANLTLVIERGNKEMELEYEIN